MSKPLVELCNYCNEKGRVVVPAYGNSLSSTACPYCKGTKMRPSKHGKEIIDFVRRYA